MLEPALTQRVAVDESRLAQVLRARRVTTCPVPQEHDVLVQAVALVEQLGTPCHGRTGETTRTVPIDMVYRMFKLRPIRQGRMQWRCPQLLKTGPHAEICIPQRQIAAPTNGWPVAEEAKVYQHLHQFLWVHRPQRFRAQHMVA